MRRLSLTKEVLTELDPAELGAVVGGAQTVKSRLCPTDPCVTPPVSQLRCSYSLSPEVCG
jgi:hypothetical protein